MRTTRYQKWMLNPCDINLSKTPRKVEEKPAWYPHFCIERRWYRRKGLSQKVTAALPKSFPNDQSHPLPLVYQRPFHHKPLIRLHQLEWPRAERINRPLNRLRPSNHHVKCSIEHRSFAMGLGPRLIQWLKRG